MFVIDLGDERKIKLQAENERMRDAWVNAIEEAKQLAWSAEEQSAYDAVASASSSSLRATTSASSLSQMANRDVELELAERPDSPNRTKTAVRAHRSGELGGKPSPGSHLRGASTAREELIPGGKHSCCVFM